MLLVPSGGDGKTEYLSLRGMGDAVLVGYYWGAGLVSYIEKSEFIGISLNFPLVFIIINLDYCILGSVLE